MIVQKGMEARPVCTVHAIDVTSCHGNDDKAWSTSCLIMQYKPYIVEQLPMCPLKSYYHYTKLCKLVEYKATRQMTGIGSI